VQIIPWILMLLLVTTVEVHAQQALPPSTSIGTASASPAVPPTPDKNGVYLEGPGITSPIVLQRAPVVYPADAPAEMIEGMTVFSLIINPDGAPVSIQVIQSHGASFDTAAMNAVKQSKFEPGTLHEKPVPVHIYAKIKFYGDKSPAFPRISGHYTPKGNAQAELQDNGGSAQPPATGISGIGPSTSSAVVTPPDHPITREQLQRLLTTSKLFEVMKQYIQKTLPQRMKSLPAWVPSAISAEIEAKIESIDLVENDLPIYQKYVSQDQAEDMILFLQGDTGEQIARRMSRGVLQALESGLKGSAAEEKALQIEDNQDIQALYLKRFKELSPEIQGRVFSNFLSLSSAWKNIDDEQERAFRQKQIQIIQSVSQEHKTELQAAKRAASR